MAIRFLCHVKIKKAKTKQKERRVSYIIQRKWRERDRDRDRERMAGTKTSHKRIKKKYKGNEVECQILKFWMR